MTIVQELQLFLDYTFDEMQTMKQWGCISDRLYGHWLFLWLWGAFRHDHRHERLYRHMGPDVYWRRIDRVKALIDRIRAVPVPPLERIPFRAGSLNP